MTKINQISANHTHNPYRDHAVLSMLTKCFWVILVVSFAGQVQASTYYFHNDHLGTPLVLTDEDQNVVWQGRYDPFGKVDETVALVEQNLRFPGQYLDRETGLHYNYFRDYDPETGRYVQSDPIGLYGGVNTYGYGFQNAIRFTDPTGEIPPQLFTAIIGGTMGFGFSILTQWVWNGIDCIDLSKAAKAGLASAIVAVVNPLGTYGNFKRAKKLSKIADRNSRNKLGKRASGRAGEQLLIGTAAAILPTSLQQAYELSKSDLDAESDSCKDKRNECK